MPRPLRLEFEGAFHHVMNRGRNRQTIFHDADYFEAFLTTLKEASERYRNRGSCIEIGGHVYCNRYIGMTYYPACQDH